MRHAWNASPIVHGFAALSLVAALASPVWAAVPTARSVPSSVWTGAETCRGARSDVCRLRPFDTSQDVAVVLGGFARPAVARESPIAFHPARNLNDGYFGNGSAWVSGGAGSWVKIDLGREVPVAAVRIGRDRVGAFDDRDPGRIVISVATDDAVYADGDDTKDSSEYQEVFDSSKTSFAGTIRGAETLELAFPVISARFVKLQVERAGAALDEVQVLQSLDVRLSVTGTPGAVDEDACKPGFSPPGCTTRPFDTRGDLAASSDGVAAPVVAKDVIAGFPNIHAAAFLNDGSYGNGSSWVSGGASSWVKVDLGRVAPIDAVRFGRDRTGGFDDRDPGRIILSVAAVDGVYASGDDTADDAEYRIVFDSADTEYSGAIEGRRTMEISFSPTPARFVKLQVERAGAALDELEVSSRAFAGLDCRQATFLGRFSLESALGGYLTRPSKPSVTTGATPQDWTVECRNGRPALFSQAGDALARAGAGLTTSTTLEPWTFEVLDAMGAGGYVLRLRSSAGEYLNLNAAGALGWSPAYSLGTIWYLRPSDEAPDPKKVDWSCVPGSSVPVRVRAGEVECASDGGSCLSGCGGGAEISIWVRPATMPEPTPISCASPRVRRASGYEVSGSWCAAACASLTGCTAMGVGELARRRPATQSSCSKYSKDDDAAGAVDGVVSGTYGFHTSSEAEPWWQVDLQEPAVLTEVSVYNRGDCCSDREAPLFVEASDDGREFHAVGVFETLPPGGPTKLPLPSVRARYLRLALGRTGPLHLDEVEVLGRRASTVLPSSSYVGAPIESPPAEGAPVPARARVSAELVLVSSPSAKCLTASPVSSGPDASGVTLEACSGGDTQAWRWVGRRLELGGTTIGRGTCLEIDPLVTRTGDPHRLRQGRCSETAPSQSVTLREDGKLELQDGTCVVLMDGKTKLGSGDCGAALRWQARSSRRRVFLEPLGASWRALGEVCDADACTVRAIVVPSDVGKRSALALEMQPGLEDPSGVSFALAREPTRFLTRVGDRLAFAPVSDRASRAQATFGMSEGLADGSGRSLELSTQRGRWVHVDASDEARAEAAASGDAFLRSATFTIEPWTAAPYVAPAPLGFAPLMTVADPRCLVPRGAAKAGAEVVLGACPSPMTAAQRWGLNDAGDYRHEGSGLCLTAPARGACASPSLHLEVCANLPEQKWALAWDESFRSLSQGEQCLGVSAAGAPVLDECPAKGARIWSAIDASTTGRFAEGVEYCVPKVPWPVVKKGNNILILDQGRPERPESCTLSGRADHSKARVCGPGSGCDPDCAAAAAAMAVDLDPSLASLVRRFAPIVHFSARQRGFPMSAQRFYEALEAGAPELATEASPGLKIEAIDARAPTYYQATSCGRQVRIQYWWFYGMQEACVPSIDGAHSLGQKTGRHHGDWEGIVVTLTEDRSDIAAVTFSQHNGWYTRIAGPRHAACRDAGELIPSNCEGEPGFEQIGTHVVVYSGHEAHGSFHDARSQVIEPCLYWTDHRGGGPRLSTWNNLVSLERDAEPWMTRDRSGDKSFKWGPADGPYKEGGVSTHPTLNPPTAMKACRGDAYPGAKDAGCLRSECLSGDEQIPSKCLKDCKKGFTSLGFACHKWGKVWADYLRDTYSYDYELPTTDAGLARRRKTNEEFRLP